MATPSHGNAYSYTRNIQLTKMKITEVTYSVGHILYQRVQGRDDIEHGNDHGNGSEGLPIGHDDNRLQIL